jgi:hypothetical protein
MNQRREEEHLMEIKKLSCPRKDRLLGFLKGASGGMSSQTLGACLEHVPDHAHRGLQTFHEGIFCLGEIHRTVRAFVDDAATMILCGIGRMIFNVSRVTYRALESEKFHVIDLLSGLMRSTTDGRENPICPGIPIT